MVTTIRQAVGDDVFVNNSYRGVTVPPKWVMTSKCQGKACVSQLKADPKRVLLADVMGYENPDVVARISHELDCSITKAAEIFTDLKKFLWLSTQRPEQDLIPTPTIDEGWHAFVLFTQDYADFCDKYFGAFIHHTAHRVGEPICPRIDLIPSINAMHEFLGGIPSTNWHYVPVGGNLVA